MSIIDILAKVWPLLVLQAGVQIYALIDLFRHKSVKSYTVTFWAVIIIVGEILGPIVYFLVGRAESDDDDL